MRRPHLSAPEGERRAGPGGGPERIDEPGRAHDVRDGVPCPDLVKGDVRDREAVYLRFGLGEGGEDGSGPLRDRAGEAALAEPGADVGEAAMGMRVVPGRIVVRVGRVMAGGPRVVGVALFVVMRMAVRPLALVLGPVLAQFVFVAPVLTLTMFVFVAVFVAGGARVRDPLGAGRGGRVEAQTPKDSVRERLGPHGDDLVQAGLCEPRRERFRALGEGVEKRRRKHVAGHPADGIQMYMHPRDSTPVSRRRRIGQACAPDARNRLRVHLPIQGREPARS